VTPWPDGARPLGLQEAAALIGEHCWIERRLFELLGRWSALTRHAPATIALDRHSQHAAWRAAQWWDRLPVLAQVDRDALVAPSRPWRALLDDPALDGPEPTSPSSPSSPASPSSPSSPSSDGAPAEGDPDPGVGRLAVAYRVLLPHLVVAYGRHARATSPVADAPVIRTLGHVRPDAIADWAEGEEVLQALLATPDAVAAAAAAVASAEALLLER
jgi:hypothetical protein